MKVSARNQLQGTITSIVMGEVNAEVKIGLSAGVEVTAIVTKQACAALGLEVGGQAWAIFKASQVMLGVE